MLLDDLSCPILELTPAGRLRFANVAAIAALGLTDADLDLALLERLAVPEVERARLARRLALLTSGRVQTIRLRVETHDCSDWPKVWRLSARHDAGGSVAGLAAWAEPVQMRAGEEPRNLSAERLADFSASMPEWFWETDAQHRFTYLSERLEAITGISRVALLGRCRTEVMATSLPAEMVNHHAADLAARRPFHNLTYELVVEGKRKLIRVSGRPIFDSFGHFQGYRGVGWEVGGIEQTRERARYLGNHDPLTGLINRQSLGDLLQASLAGAAASGSGLALFALDLEDFKRVNDSYGHGIGDQLLQQAAARLRRCVAGIDSVARLGGDEFAVVSTLKEASTAAAIKIAESIAERIAERLRQPFVIEGHEIFSGVRIGVTLSPLHGNTMPLLLQQADLALHEAKRHGKGICVFGVELSAATQRRKSIEDSLRRALARDEMSLVLQPQFAVRGRTLIGCEALLRWRHGQPDEIGPGIFVPIAEETGLIVSFGSWVLREACRLGALWWRDGQGPRMAVNLSPVQFWDRDLCREVEEALDAAKLPPRALELEITEGVLMRDTQAAADTLNKLNDLGVAIALDDFGTGFSSLSYLKRFPIHRLKIDQTFIRDLDHDEDDRQITKAIVGLGHSLKLEVVAEGVETTRQLAFLADLKCDVAQGYLFSPPLTVSAFKAALRDNAWPTASAKRRDRRLGSATTKTPRSRSGYHS